jgi:hypothetical protein
MLTRILCTVALASIALAGASAHEAPSDKSKVTVVFDHALPNVPGKSMKGVLVEYQPGGSSPAHTHPDSAFIYATVLAGRSAARSTTARKRSTGPARASPSCPATITASAPMRARPSPHACSPCSSSTATRLF